MSKHTINLCFDTNLPTGGCELLDLFQILCEHRWKEAFELLSLSIVGGIFASALGFSLGDV